MMFLFGGVPDLYHQRFVEKAIRELSDDFFTSLPLLPSSDRSYTVDHAYCDELIKTLIMYVEGRPSCLDGGLGVILLLRSWEKNTFETDFWPFALCETVQVKALVSRNGIGAERVANIYSTLAISAAKRLRKPLRALTSEFATRLRRTPLLLPVDHFNSQHLLDLIRETLETVKQVQAPDDQIKAACRRFETRHPFSKSGQGGSFENGKGVQFTAPGREIFHGRRNNRLTGEHNEGCFLNARVRLGGFYSDGFHYDCTRGKGRYEGWFSNCHNAEAKYIGRPHLNVYPNNFIS